MLLLLLLPGYSLKRLPEWPTPRGGSEQQVQNLKKDEMHVTFIRSGRFRGEESLLDVYFK